MFYYLSQYLQEAVAGTQWADTLSALRLFRYITFRTAGAAVTALLVSWFLAPPVIEGLKRLRFRQEYRDAAESVGDLRARFLDKRGTPVMGGLLIVLAIDLSVLLWARWNVLTVLTLVALVGLCGLGFYDDYTKLTLQDGKGLRAKTKLGVQSLLALAVMLYLWWLPETRRTVTDIMVPFVKHPVLTGATAAGMALGVCLIVGTSNAVNLTDGLDGLAIGCTLIVTVVFLILTYLAGNARTAAYLQVPYVPGAGELTVVCGAMFGAALGFLWYNCHPAQVFMGDTGSLALGGTLGIIAILIQQPFVLVIAGGVFFAEAGSVVIQVGCFQYFKRFRGVDRRVFLRTPLHHHFEMKGWYESKIVMRFYILAVLCGVLALATLKLR